MLVTIVFLDGVLEALDLIDEDTGFHSSVGAEATFTEVGADLEASDPVLVEGDEVLGVAGVAAVGRAWTFGLDEVQVLEDLVGRGIVGVAGDDAEEDEPKQSNNAERGAGDGDIEDGGGRGCRRDRGAFEPLLEVPAVIESAEGQTGEADESESGEGLDLVGEDLVLVRDPTTFTELSPGWKGQQ